MGAAEVEGLEGEVKPLPPTGVPAREAAAEEGLVGETDPPVLERWNEKPPSLVGEGEAVDDGIVLVSLVYGRSE